MMDGKSSQEDEKPQTVDVKDEPKTEESQEAGAGIKDYLRILAYSDRWDLTFNGVGAIAAIASGASLALYVDLPNRNALGSGHEIMLTAYTSQNQCCLWRLRHGGARLHERWQ